MRQRRERRHELVVEAGQGVQFRGLQEPALVEHGTLGEAQQSPSRRSGPGRRGMHYPTASRRASSRAVRSRRAPKGGLQVDLYEAGRDVRCRLADVVHVGADDGRHHDVAAAGHGVAVQHDRFDTAGDLDRPDGVRGIDDVGGIAPGAERRNALAELEHGPPVAEPGPVRNGCETPLGLEECPASGVGEAMVVETHHHPDLAMARMGASQRLGHGPARSGTVVTADRELVARHKRPAVQPAEGTEAVGRPAAEHHRHVEAPR